MSEFEKQEENHSSNNFHSVSTDKLVFENVYGELEYFKKKCEVLEKDLFKSQTQIKKLELNLKKTQDFNSVYGKNMNNTSISFFLPSEFKTLWENFSKDLLLEAFDCLYDDYINLSHVSHDVIKITYGETKEFIQEKINSVLKVFNIDTKSNENYNTTKEEKFHLLFRSIFQEYFSQIFVFTDEFNDKIKNRLIGQVKEYSNIDNNDNKSMDDVFQDFIEDINKNPFKNLIQNLYKLCMYMLLHDPVLTFDIPPYKERKLNFMFYNKTNMLNIEGFGNEETPCVIIVPTPLINNKHIYLGIKPAVYCLQKSLAYGHILAECERFKNGNLNHRPTDSNAELSLTSQHLNHNEVFIDNNLSVTPTKNTNQKLIKPIPVQSSNNYSALPSTKQNNIISYSSNNNCSLSNTQNKTEEKQIENNKGSLINMQSEKSFLKNNNKIKFEKSKKYLLNLLSLELSAPSEKKNNDRPLTSKIKQLEEIKIQPRNKISAKTSFISQDINTNNGIALKNNKLKTYKSKNSGSSINESVELNESKTGNSNSLLQINNNTKSSRSNYPNSTIPNSTSGNSIPIQIQKSSTTNEHASESAQSKKFNHIINEDRIQIKKSETNFKNNLLQKETKFSSQIKTENLLNQKEEKANPTDPLDKFQFDKYEKSPIQTLSPKKINANNNYCYTNINNISRKNDSDKLTSEKFANYPVNISSLNRLTPKEIKIERRIDMKNQDSYQIFYEELNKNNRTINDNFGKFSSQIKINRIRDGAKMEQDKINSIQANSASHKFSALNKENLNIASSKTQKLDIENLIGNAKYYNNEVKNKMQKFYDVLTSNPTRDSEKDNLLITHKNIVGISDKLEKKLG